MHFAVFSDLFEQAQLTGLAINNDRNARHEEIFFLILQLMFDAWIPLFQVVNDLADGITRYLHFVLTANKALHFGGEPHFRHVELPLIMTVLRPDACQRAAGRHRKFVVRHAQVAVDDKKRLRRGMVWDWPQPVR